MNTSPRSMPCYLFKYSCPVFKNESGKYVDNIGFEPDIHLNFSEYNKWIKITQQYLEGK